MAKHKSKPNKIPPSQPARKKQHPPASAPTLSVPSEQGNMSKGGQPEEYAVHMTLKARVFRFLDAIHSAFTANRIMAGFTIVIAIAAIEQANIYRLQLTEMRIGQRAWLKVKFSPFNMAVNGHACASIVITDTGKTPAKHIEGIAVVRNIPISDSVDFQHPPISAAENPVNPPLGAFSIFRMGAIFPDDPLPLNEFCLMDSSKPSTDPQVWTATMQDRFDKGDTYIDTHGEFAYDDAAGRQHWTRFCYLNVAAGKQPNLSAARSCAAYNSIDEN